LGDRRLVSAADCIWRDAVEDRFQVDVGVLEVAPVSWTPQLVPAAVPAEDDTGLGAGVGRAAPAEAGKAAAEACGSLLVKRRER
jgi:hypothetical protein